MKLLIPASITFLLVFAQTTAFAQSSLATMKQQMDKEELQFPKGWSMKLINNTQAGILFKANVELSQTNVIPWLKQKLVLRPDEDDLIDESRDIITGEYTVKKIHQYYKGIKVEHGVINTTSRNGKIAMMQMEYYTVPDRFNTRPALSEEQAFARAITYMGAETYAWNNDADTTEEDRRKPAGELVIIQTYQNENGDVCLAYKFNMYAINPLKRSYIYVNAMDGKIVLDDPIIKHAHKMAAEALAAATEKNNRPLIASPLWQLSDPINTTTGTATTKYNGIKSIRTDLYSGTAAKPYRLREVINNHKVITLDYQRKSDDINGTPSNELQALDFYDNDNNWTAAEFHNSAMDDAAMDVQYNMEWISDYWKQVHDRNSWNNNNGDVISYIHVKHNGANFDNAYWNGTNMHFGDGNASGSDPAQCTLDDCAHELAHGVASTTAGLIYRWESGAMNEALSDIWAACITNYAKTNDPTLTSEILWRMFEKSSVPATANPGLRDLQTPLLFQQPSTYHSRFWTAGDYETCHTPIPLFTPGGDNDACGVHTNSGVLNKWFYLITAGEVSTNTKGNAYNITGLGFAVSQKIVYLMELNLTPNASYTTAMAVSLNVAATSYGYGSGVYNTLKSAWAAVGVDTVSTFNMANTPVFTTNNFTSITVGEDGYIFAGTNYSGFYQFDGDDWTKKTELPDVRFNDLKTDPSDGSIWIAQSGKQGTIGGGSSSAGGVNHLVYPYLNPSVLYTVDPTAHVPSRNARCMYIDPYRTNDGNSKAWVATTSYITSSNSTSGMLGVGLNNSVPEFAKISEGINIASGTAGCLTIGGNKKEIWTFSQANFGVNQLLTYDAASNALITTYDHNSIPIIPSGFVARAIYGDRFKRMWVGLATGGILIYDENKQWHYFNSPSIFPPGVAVNYNAITGNKHGDIYIGTTSGMVFFDAGGGWANRLEDTLYYRRYGKANGLMSDNINAIAYDAERFKVWIASDSGIVKWDPPCIGNFNCRSSPGTKTATSNGNGNWSNPAVWDTGIIPDSATDVLIVDSITVDINANCHSLLLAKPGTLKVNTGKNLTIFDTGDEIFTGGQEERRKRRR